MVFDGFIMFLMDHGVCLCDVSINYQYHHCVEREIDAEAGFGVWCWTIYKAIIQLK